jgi:hypothetical protein
MMNTRAKASILLSDGKFAEAMREIERGRDLIVDFFQSSNFPELAQKSSEIAFLEEWLEEVSSKRPLSKLEIMQREMEVADRERALRARRGVARRDQAAQARQ